MKIKSVNFLLIITFFLVISCAETQPVKKNNKKVYDKSAEKKEDKRIHQPRIKTGWYNEDTYTVSVIADNEEEAVSSAKTKILKDIVKVRYKLYGKYSQIAIIKEEFAKPLRNGEVIGKRKKDGRIEIYFRIREKGLRKKFELK